MTIDDKVITWLIAGIGVLVALVTWLRTRGQDVRKAASDDSGMRHDLDYIKRGVDDIRDEQRAMRDDMRGLAERLSKVEGRLEDHINMHPPD